MRPNAGIKGFSRGGDCGRRFESPACRVLPAASTNSSGVYTNSDGTNPWAGLNLSDSTLYGTTAAGGSSGHGTVFKVNTDGTGFANLHSFTGSSDGAVPFAGLVLSGNSLYGTTGGGSSGHGTVFKVNTDGTSFTNLHDFTGGSDGAEPHAGLVLSGNTLYGTTRRGGNPPSTQGFGTIFSISLPANPPQLSITPAAANVILTWPTNATGFTLQSSTSLSSPAWTTNLPAAVLINGQNTVTNPIVTAQQFFRLSQ